MRLSDFNDGDYFGEWRTVVWRNGNVLVATSGVIRQHKNGFWMRVNQGPYLGDIPVNIGKVESII